MGVVENVDGEEIVVDGVDWVVDRSTYGAFFPGFAVHGGDEDWVCEGDGAAIASDFYNRISYFYAIVPKSYNVPSNPFATADFWNEQ